MASEKKITMREYNGTDYDTLYPKTIAEQVDGIYGKDEVLSNGTKALYGLTDSAVPNDVLALIKTLIDTGDASTNANANSRAKIATGSYTGTGTIGTFQPVTLTFDFAPKIIFVFSTGTYGAIVVKGTITTTQGSLKNASQHGLFFEGNYVRSLAQYYIGFEFGDNYVKFGADYGNANYQLNASNTTYSYVAIG